MVEALTALAAGVGEALGATFADADPVTSNNVDAGTDSVAVVAGASARSAPRHWFWKPAGTKCASSCCGATERSNKGRLKPP